MRRLKLFFICLLCALMPVGALAALPGPQPGGGSSSQVSTGQTLVDSDTVTTSATALSVSGLDSDTDLVYVAYAMINLTGSDASTSLFITYNGGTTQNETGYVRENTNGSAKATTSNNNTLLTNLSSSGNVRSCRFTIINGRVSAGNLNYPSTYYSCFSSDTGIDGSIYFGLGDNSLTSFSIRSTSMSFGPGSFLKIYKYGG